MALNVKVYKYGRFFDVTVPSYHLQGAEFDEDAYIESRIQSQLQYERNQRALEGRQTIFDKLRVIVNRKRKAISEIT